MAPKIDTRPVGVSAETAALFARYSGASADRKGGVFPQVLDAPRPQAPAKYAAPVGQSNTGYVYRQAPRNPDAVPDTIPRNLPKGINEGIAGQKTPIPTKQYSPRNLPNPQIPVAAKLLNAANSLDSKFNSLGSAANRVTGVLAVGAMAANYAKNPNLENGLKTGLAALTVATAGIPYVNAAVFALNIGVIAYDMFSPFRSPNNSQVDPTFVPLYEGGQAQGVLYRVFVKATYNNPDKSTYVTNGSATFFDLNQFTPTNPFFAFSGPLSGLTIITKPDGSKTWQIGEQIPSSNTFGVIGFGTQYYPQVIEILKVERVDGLPDINPDTQAPVIVINNDGSERPDLVQTVQDNLDQVQGKLDLLQQIAAANNLDLQTIKDLVSLPRNNNNAVPLAIAANPIAGIPKPLPVPSGAVNQLTTIDKSNLAAIAPSRTPIPANNGLVDRLNQQIKDAQALSAKQSQALSTKQLQTTTVNQVERFKQSDCKFSCENLAKCFVDVKVLIFDGCDATNGTAKTKEITIQVLPKDVEKTKATFKEFLDIRSRECSLADRVLTVPDYWQIRTGQRPQAVVLYREFLNGKFTDNYYSQSIPHYDKPKGSRPNLTQWNKGEYSAIYLCKDNSKVQVYASSEAEAKRVINEFTNSISPRMRGDIVKFGKRMGIKKTTVKPVRLDFFSTGQTKLSPDWSVSL